MGRMTTDGQTPTPAAPPAPPVPRDFLPVSESGLHRRAYLDYGQYLSHQAEKLRSLRDRIEPSDREYEAVLFERLSAMMEDRSVGPLAGRSVLCLGARLGGEVRAFKRLGALAIGVDIEPGERNPHVLFGDFHDLAFPDGCFDAAFTNAVDHAWDLRRLASEVVRVLKPGGCFLLEICAERPGRYEVIDTSDPAPVLEVFDAALERSAESPVHNRTSYLNWTGSLYTFRKCA